MAGPGVGVISFASAQTKQHCKRPMQSSIMANNRIRESTWPMVPMDRAIDTVLANAQPGKAQDCSVQDPQVRVGNAAAAFVLQHRPQ